MSPRVKGALLLLLVFLLGVAAGALAFGLFGAEMGWRNRPRDPERFRELVLKRLTKELDLQPEQRQKVEAILRETGQEFARLKVDMDPRIREIRGHSRERMRAILTPEQRTKLEVLEKEWERRAERRRSEGGRLKEGGSKSP
jgi:Spy/CpxP family protein refolding chaperone